MIDVENIGRVRLLHLNRPAKNAFNEAQYDRLTELLLEAESDSTVAVVVITGQGDSFSSGTDVVELGQRMADPSFTPGTWLLYGRYVGELLKPLVCAVNGLGLGIG